MNKLQKIIAAGLISLPLILGIPGCKKAEDSANANRNSASTSSISTPRAPINEENPLRDTILSYLAQPKFSSSDLMEQITGTKAKLQMLNLDEKKVYLSIPKEDFVKGTLERLTSNPNSVEFGRTSNGEHSGDTIELGKYELNKPGNYFFRFPSNDFKVDASKTVSISYKRANYSITMQELQDFSDNTSIYGGYLRVDTGTDEYGTHKIISNHGALVAKKGEKSLERLVSSLVGSETSKERKAQKLLDFVTQEIKYDHSEANASVEVLKRPNEVLMTRGSDCSGKVILYASLLEQAGIDYRLVYNCGHITTAVEGEYPNRNNLSFNLGDKTYSIAETTAEGFQIGKSTLDKGFSIKDIKYVQKPGENSELRDIKTGQALYFR